MTMYILFILTVLFFIFSWFNCYKSKQYEKNAKDYLNEAYYKLDAEDSLYNLKLKAIEELDEKIKKEEERISTHLERVFQNRAEILEDDFKSKQNSFSEQLTFFESNLLQAKEQYLKTIEESYIDKENEYDNLIQQYEFEIKNLSSSIKELKDALSAGVQAQLREQEKEDNLQFYKLSVSEADLIDINKLNSIKPTLSKPVVLSKLIWTQYFQKQTTEMCNRILGAKQVCGIYKITNLKTKQCYIGQSIHIQDRIKQHIKCGLGIDASATNKLYNSMQTDGVWNFTFELIEECSKEQLDKKEKQWIEMYQTNLFGYNGNKGNG